MSNRQDMNASAGDAAKTFRGKLPGPPVFESKLEEREYIKFPLAQAFRMVCKRGYDEGVAGIDIQGTMTLYNLSNYLKDPIKPDCFWVNPFVRCISIIWCSYARACISNGPFRRLNIAVFMIHSVIHVARPDFMCAAHSHSKTLDPINQDMCAFYDVHEVEGKAIAEALGFKKDAILQNHGLLVATSTIEATLHFYITLERSCQAQLLVDAAAAGTGAKTVFVDSADAAQTSKSQSRSFFA
ncbi:class II aldolase/adducin domain protein [Mycena rebaudengoi]|nr:class II aldolase/adducin domain protein [Mycena rebaudengoi]